MSRLKSWRLLLPLALLPVLAGCGGAVTAITHAAQLAVLVDQVVAGGLNFDYARMAGSAAELLEQFLASPGAFNYTSPSTGIAWSGTKNADASGTATGTRDSTPMGTATWSVPVVGPPTSQDFVYDITGTGERLEWTVVIDTGAGTITINETGHLHVDEPTNPANDIQVNITGTHTVTIATGDRVVNVGGTLTGWGSFSYQANVTEATHVYHTTGTYTNAISSVVNVDITEDTDDSSGTIHFTETSLGTTYHTQITMPAGGGGTGTLRTGSESGPVVANLSFPADGNTLTITWADDGTTSTLYTDQSL